MIKRKSGTRKIFLKILGFLARSHTENIENITKFMFESFLNFSIPASMNDIEA